MSDLKSVEVFCNELPVNRWSSDVNEGSCLFVDFSPDGLLLWGHELLEAIVQTGSTITVEKIVADKVIATWTDGRVEEMTGEDTVIYDLAKVREVFWDAYKWPTELGPKGGAAK